MSLNIFKSFLVALDLNDATIFNDKFRCTARTFYSGKTDKRLELRITPLYTKQFYKNLFTLTIFLVGNHNTPRHHYTITNPHVLTLIREDHALLNENKLQNIINFIIEFGDMWRGIIEFDSDELTENTITDITSLNRFKEMLNLNKEEDC